MVLSGKLADGWGNSLQEDAARAERLLRQALERDANRSMAHFAMGVLHQTQNRLAEAQVEYETAIALDRNDARAFFLLGQTLMFLGQPEAGIPHIEKAIRLDPHDPDVTTLYWAFGRLPAPSGPGGSGNRHPQEGPRHKFSAVVSSSVPRRGVRPPRRFRRGEGCSG
jgi:tetratricopeptide (TPR) repeat protein